MIRTERILLGVLAALGALVIAHVLEQAQFGRANVVMVHMLAVIVVAALLGLWPAVAMSLLGIPLYNVFDVPPYFELDRNELAHTFPLAVTLATAAIVSSLAGRLRLEARESEQRAVRTAALYALAAELAEDMAAGEIAVVTARHIARISDAGFDVDSVRAGGLTAIRGGMQAAGDDAYLEAMLRLAEQAIERAALRERLRTSELRAQQETLRSSILGAVSHDLRTPLASIIGASSTLIESGSGFTVEVRQRLQQVIYDEAEHMRSMVQNLLDLARLRSGGVGGEREWQAIEEIVGSTMASKRRRIRDHQLVVDVPDDLPLIRCDGVLIERVLSNMLENAVKFSPAGSRIDLRAGVDGNDLVVTVCDQGPGVPEALREKVLEAFFSAGSKGGSGLGLAICRGIVEAHGGSIMIGSAPGGGACVAIRLPIPAETPIFALEDNGEDADDHHG